jgi:tRNA-specific 2-thiouridylase
MSGGVDSSVAALLLQHAGYEVVGCYMRNWSEDLPGMHCPWAEDLADAKRVATKLGLEFRVLDFERQYKQKVVDYMLAEYRAGRTPNPDVMCNQEIKFRLFYDVAREAGADLVATGHYAQIIDGQLARATDTNKDQTYFLYRIPTDALEHTLFPIGHLHKSAVKQLAAEHGLATATKKESMGICFVGEVDIRQFLRQYIDITAGPIVDETTGEILGTHEGVPFYTIGQRHGLYLASDLPYYVSRKDATTNTIYVTKNLNSPSLWSQSVQLRDIVFRGDATPVGAPKEPATLKVRVRHRAPLINATLDGDKLTFVEPERSLSPGQSVVFYGGPHHEFCLGGGTIA